MPQSAYVKLVAQSTQQSLTLDDVEQKFSRYIEQTGHTGKQLNWDYSDHAFPYTIEHKPEGEGVWFYLKGKDPQLYKGMIVGIGSEPLDVDDVTNTEAVTSTKREQAEMEQPPQNVRHFIQIVLPDGALHGDKAKGNEFAKYLAKQFQAELHLFNGRVMFFFPRK
nr:DUF1885 family protein [Numidum massiliense]